MAKLTDGVADALLDAVGTMVNGGWLDLLADDGTVLASLRLGSPAFKAASAGAASAQAITAETSAKASGVAARYELRSADRTTVVQEGTVGRTGSASDLVLNAASIVEGAEVRIDSYVMRLR